MPERPELSYRIVIHEFDGDQETVIFDTTARAFIVVSGTLDKKGTMHGNGTYAGPLHMQNRLARIIAEDEQLAD